MDLTHWREDYNKYNLKEKDLHTSPWKLFEEWFQKASEDKNPEPNAMVLSTVSGDEPDARVVLLKEVENQRFIFYTNYNSTKGHEISENPNVHLLFIWLLSQRQVRIKGVATKLSRQKSEAYFASRPTESQISAIASPQSQRIEFEDLLKNIEAVNELKCPEHWGGYGVTPTEFEFWQGQSGRLHDRVVYKKITEDKWEIFRLAP